MAQSKARQDWNRNPAGLDEEREVQIIQSRTGVGKLLPVWEFYPVSSFNGLHIFISLPSLYVIRSLNKSIF